MEPKIQLFHSTLEIKNETLKIDFNQLQNNSIRLDLHIANAHADEEWIWEIYSQYGQVDSQDLTRGLQAELILLRSYTGPNEKPNTLEVIVKSLKTKKQAKLKIQIFTKTKINEAFWSKESEEKKIYKVPLNKNFKIYLQGEGLVGLPMTLSAFFINAKTGKEFEVGNSSEFEFEDFYEKGFYIPQKMFSIFKDIIPAFVKEKLSPYLASTGQIRNESLGKMYFVLKSKDKIWFDGKKEREFVEIYFDFNPFPEEEDLSDSTTLSPVLFGTEQYFTQKYEPCKYTAIKFLDRGNSSIVFDENEPSPTPTKKTEYKLLASNEVVQILVNEVDTIECQFNEENRAITSNPSERRQDHTGHVIDVSDLYENHFLRIQEHTDELLSFSLEYPYIKEDYIAFLTDYFFHAPLEFKIPIRTCRYSQTLNLSVYPDALWTLHFNHFVEQDYFYKNQPLSLQKGFTQLWAFLTQNNHNLQNAMAAFLGGISVFKWAIGEENYKVLMEDFKEYLESVQLGFHSQFLTQEGKQTLDYSQEYYLVAQYIIFCNFSLRWALEIFFIYLSKGRNLVKLGAKAQKWVDKTSKKVKKIKDTLDKYDLTIHYPAIATNHALYYEKLPDGQIALIVEHNVKADPMIGINYYKKFKLSELSNHSETENVGVVMEKLKDDAEIEVNFDGIISGEYNVKTNLETGETSFIEKAGNFLYLQKNTITNKETIKGEIKAVANKNFKFKSIDTDINIKGELEAKGEFIYKRSYGKDEQGIWFADELYFSGVKGSYMVNVKTKFQNKKVFESNPEETPVPFVLFKPNTLKFPKTYLLKI
jgi:hypothetical protein